MKNKLFHTRLKELRKERKLSQRDIAELLDVSHQSASAYENIREPNIEQLLKLANYFDVSLDWLLGASSIRTKTRRR